MAPNTTCVAEQQQQVTTTNMDPEDEAMITEISSSTAKEFTKTVHHLEHAVQKAVAMVATHLVKAAHDKEPAWFKRYRREQEEARKKDKREHDERWKALIDALASSASRDANALQSLKIRTSA